MQLAETAATPSKWEAVIISLSEQVAQCDREVAALQRERVGLLLDAETGNVAAGKRIARIDEEIVQKQKQAGQKRETLQQARPKHAESLAAEAAEKERQRLGEMNKRARVVIKHAGAFTAALRQAAAEGQEVKAAVHDMLAEATVGEQQFINRLLELAPFMRAAEFAGLCAVDGGRKGGYLEFPPYRGPKAHIVALETEFAVYLERWLKPSNGGDGKERNAE